MEYTDQLCILWSGRKPRIPLTWYRAGVSPPPDSIESSIFFLSSIASGVSMPAGILVKPLGVINPASAGVTRPECDKYQKRMSQLSALSVANE